MYKPSFLQSIYEFMLAAHYSKRTITTYLTWIKSFIRCNGNQHPKDMGEIEVLQ